MNSIGRCTRFQKLDFRMNLIYYVCVFAIGALTVGAAGLKFGTELGFHPEMVLSFNFFKWAIPGLFFFIFVFSG